ncbi:U3 small nucleolar ribonucleoprotein IMP3 [Nematocida major]|uniref:U3 small nucleolar ribonucleoprotein IMP3 n=1 Tax=Nematocida major TaxID=1912982 RepID=UPI002008A8BA|nr:U3 small nucleolar ribonucleoprotein IMP3 [Nematocida major]KAH9385832.1 U3 small nucleolar ribonucleoprotein IMP3 [Nematocida major]
MRTLKHHEKKLLRKVDLLEWKGTSTVREQAVTRRYQLQDRETYTKYNYIVGMIKRLSLALAKLNDNEPMKQILVRELSSRLFSLGLINAKTLLECAGISVAAFCKRRLSSVLESTKIVPDIKTAVTFIGDGHIKVGTEIVTDPSLIVSRTMQDYITWREGSAVKRTIDEFTE